MPPELPDRLLGISIDDPSERDEPDDEAEIEVERFVFVRIGEHRLAFPVDDVKTIADPPEAANVTRVPRAPPAVEGLFDLRGEITAILDSRVHFPVDEPAPEDASLLVFDRPTDDQSAALLIDQVLGVHTIPADDVLEPADVEDHSRAGNALEHPLVVALIERERERERDRRSSARQGSGTGAGPGTDPAPTGSRPGFGSGSSTASTGLDRADNRPSGEGTGVGGDSSGTTDPDAVVADEFTLEERDHGPAAEESTIVVEPTGVVDVQKLLLASGSNVEGSGDRGSGQGS